MVVPEIKIPFIAVENLYQNDFLNMLNTSVILDKAIEDIDFIQLYVHALTQASTQHYVNIPETYSNTYPNLDLNH